MNERMAKLREWAKTVNGPPPAACSPGQVSRLIKLSQGDRASPDDASADELADLKRRATPPPVQ